MRLALVHDWLTNFAGAERVLVAMCQAFPEAPVFTSVYCPEHFPQLNDKEIRTSFLQRFPAPRPGTRHSPS